MTVRVCPTGARAGPAREVVAARAVRQEAHGAAGAAFVIDVM